MLMFCSVHTDQWSADTGYICDDDQEQEVEALRPGTKERELTCKISRVK